MTKKSYSELIKLKTFKERFDYLKINGVVCDETFGSKRYLNQILYTSQDWRSFRRSVIIRDQGSDLGIPEHEVKNGEFLIVHHINPITIEDVLNRSPNVFDLENVITTTENTHRAIHYGDETLLIDKPIVRMQNDTCLWR